MNSVYPYALYVASGLWENVRPWPPPDANPPVPRIVSGHHALAQSAATLGQSFGPNACNGA